METKQIIHNFDCQSQSRPRPSHPQSFHWNCWPFRPCLTALRTGELTVDVTVVMPNNLTVVKGGNYNNPPSQWIVQKEHRYLSLHEIIFLLFCLKCLPADYYDYLAGWHGTTQLTPMIIHLVSATGQEKCRVWSWSWHHLTLGSFLEEERQTLSTTGSWHCHQVNLGLLSAWKQTK